MATDRPLLSRRRYLGMAVETTTGTAITLTSSSAQYLVFDPKIVPNIVNEKREMPGYGGHLQGVPGGCPAKVTFKLELANSTEFALAMTACRMVQNSNVLTPLTTCTTTLTFGLWLDGWYFAAAGCAGKWKITGAAGKRAMVEFEFDGVWQTPVAAAMITGVTLPTYLPPILAAATFTINSVAAPRWSKITIDSGNVVSLREDVTAVDTTGAGTGYHSAAVTDWNPTLQIDPELAAEATLDWFSNQRAATQWALTMVVSRAGASGSIVTIAAPKLQLDKSPTVGDRTGKATAELNFGINAGSGDDEMSITLT
jgi:hypothetical protein